MTALHWASLEEGGKNAKTQWELVSFYVWFFQALFAVLDVA